jgi:hypothetical protein
LLTKQGQWTSQEIFNDDTVANVAEHVWSGITSAGQFIQEQVSAVVVDQEVPKSQEMKAESTLNPSKPIQKQPSKQESIPKQSPKPILKQSPKLILKQPPKKDPKMTAQKHSKSCIYLAIDASLDSLCTQACPSDQKECPLKFCVCQTAGDPVLSRIRGLVKQISGLIETPTSPDIADESTNEAEHFEQQEDPTDWEGIEHTADELSPFWKHMKSLLTENGPNNLSKLWESVLAAEEETHLQKKDIPKQDDNVMDNVLPTLETAAKTAGHWLQWAYDQVKVNEE